MKNSKIFIKIKVIAFFLAIAVAALILPGCHHHHHHHCCCCCGGMNGVSTSPGTIGSSGNDSLTNVKNGADSTGNNCCCCCCCNGAANSTPGGSTPGSAASKGPGTVGQGGNDSTGSKK